MALKLSGALCAAFMVMFFILSTFMPIAQIKSENTTIYDYHNTPAHTDFSALKSYTPLNYDGVKAMWFPYFEYKDILQGKSEIEFKNNIKARFTNAKELGINTVYIHVRSHGDAYYYSDIFPMASRCSGSIGDTIDFDPLDIIVNTAHDLELSVHAWVNPLRLMTPEELQLLDNSCILKQWYNDGDKNGKYIVSFEGNYYLNPAYIETRALVCDGIKEILYNYDIDGIHIDDYFYPTTDPSFDADAFSVSQSPNLENWRFENTNKLVKEIYSTIKNFNPDVLFGISPAATDNANKSLYADVDLWASQNGYCDYIVPQLYFGYTSETAPFDKLLNLWKQKCASKTVKLIIGICTYKYTSDSDEWSDSSLVARQLGSVLDDDIASGAAIYSYSSTFEPQSDFQLYEDVRSGIKNAFTITSDINAST